MYDIIVSAFLAPYDIIQKPWYHTWYHAFSHDIMYDITKTLIFFAFLALVKYDFDYVIISISQYNSKLIVTLYFERARN